MGCAGTKPKADTKKEGEQKPEGVQAAKPEDKKPEEHGAAAHEEHKEEHKKEHKDDGIGHHMD